MEMKLLTTVKRMFKMGIFGKLDKFDKLFKDRLGVNVIHLNYCITLKNLKTAQRNILKHDFPKLQSPFLHIQNSLKTH